MALAGLPVLASNRQAVLEEPVGLIPGEYKLGKYLFTIFSVLIRTAGLSWLYAPKLLMLLSFSIMIIEHLLSARHYAEYPACFMYYYISFLAQDCHTIVLPSSPFYT